ncbi:MAG: VWA domain-containing protein [Pseudomonadota bacterium]
MAEGRQDKEKAAARWRLALGRHADPALGGISGHARDMDDVLEHLYRQEYRKRGLTMGGPDLAAQRGGIGSLDPTQMTAITWLGRARAVFPEEVFETLQGHALERYGMTDILKDPKTLENLEPNKELLKVLLAFSGRADPAVKDKLRQIADRVIREIMERLRAEVLHAFSGRRNRFRRSRLASAANFDARATLRANLKTWDAERSRLIAEELRFMSRERRRVTWRIILCIDQSGSMTDSLIHAAVMGAILSGLPGIETRMVLFDTSVLDVSDRLSDPLETLLSVQLGGGTDIGRAVAYCETLVTQPERTLFVLVSDFCEGAAPRRLFSAVARMAEARVRLLGLSALDDACEPHVDHMVANRLAALGMQIAAMTPSRLADWLAAVVR